MSKISSVLVTTLVLFAACGSDPDTGKNPQCVGNSCDPGLECCQGFCQPEASVCLDDSDATVATDTNGPSDTDQDDTAAVEDSQLPDSAVTDSSATDSAVTDSNEPVDTADTSVATDTSMDTSPDTDTSPGGLVLVDPGIHTLGGAVSAGGILLLDARLDGRSRVCTGALCVEGGIAP